MAVFTPAGENPVQAQVGNPTFGGSPTETKKRMLDFASARRIPSPGQYLVVVKSYTEKTSQKGNDYIQVSFAIEQPEEYNMLTLYDRLMMVGGGLARTMNALIALGFEVTDNFEFDPKMLVGCRAWVEVINQPDDNGVMRANISRYLGNG
jgi:hypothetical protein